MASGAERDRFAIEVAEELPEVWADPDRLDQILSNLIENAFRHGEGVVTLAAQRSSDDGQAALEAKGHHAVGVDLLVADQGKGIASDHRHLVFSRFWHGSGRGSTGLGLYVVKGLVEAHGGRVQVEDGPTGAPSSGSACRPSPRTTSPESAHLPKPGCAATGSGQAGRVSHLVHRFTAPSGAVAPLH